MRWCKQNNIAFIRFNPTEKNFESFGKLINELYNDESIQEGLKCISNSINNKIYKNRSTNKSQEMKEHRKWIGNTTRMSCVELL